MMKRIGFLMLGGVSLVAACSPTSAVKQFSKGDELAYYDFSSPGTFEEGTYAAGAARLQIKDGKYDITLLEGDSELWYGQWGEPQRDVVVDVEAKQATESQNTVYGVMCRVRGTVGQTVQVDPTLQALVAENTASTPLIASSEATEAATAEATAEMTAEATAESTTEAAAEKTAEATAESTVEATAEKTVEATEAPTLAAGEATAEATSDAGAATLLTANNGDGYLFLVEGSGRFAILRSRGRSITPLVNWTPSTAILTGAAENRIRAVCVGSYLAMYVNGTFVGDATDDTYTTGQVGMVGAAASRLGLQVDFDNLTVSAAKPE
ncbi:MAG: hypothetical protein ABI690_12005 [Chloroflexota bacterium]